MTLRRVLLALPFAAATVLVLSWTHVLPGGSRMRAWLMPHAVREARDIEEHAARRRLAFAAEAPPPAGAVVFLGSSTIERFPLAASFPGVPCVDRGIGNESLPRLLERLDASLPAARPAAAVLYLGSIDFRVHGRAPARIADLAGLAVRWIRERHADLPVALIGILPERDMPPEMVARLAETNAALAALCATRGYAFVATDVAPITAADGSLEPALAADRLHLNEAGYAALAARLRADESVVGAILRGE